MPTSAAAAAAAAAPRSKAFAAGRRRGDADDGFARSNAGALSPHVHKAAARLAVECCSCLATARVQSVCVAQGLAAAQGIVCADVFLHTTWLFCVRPCAQQRRGLDDGRARGHALPRLPFARCVGVFEEGEHQICRKFLPVVVGSLFCWASSPAHVLSL